MHGEPAATPRAERGANASIVLLSGTTRPYWLGHLRDHVLRQELRDCARRESGATAELLARIGEFDARRLYADDTCSSMLDYCVRKLHLSEDAAFKRIRVARTAREFPAIFPLLADGRLTLTAVVLLSPRISAANADELLAAAVGRTKPEIELLLATRFQPAVVPAQQTLRVNSGNKVAPEPPVPSDSCARAYSGEPLLQAGAPVDDAHTVSPDTGFALVISETDVPVTDHATGNAIVSPLAAGEDLAAAPSAPASIGAAASRDALAEADMAAIAPCSHGLARYLRFTPVAANCAALKGMLSLQAMREFKRLQELAGSYGASADAADLLEKAIKAYADALEKTKFGANASARASASVSAGTSTRATHADPTRRHIPAVIRRAVYERDGGQCTFVGPDGKRCGCRTGLEFDHVQPLARRGLTTVANMRLRCPAHNQLEARRTFGERFVAGKQEQARARARAAVRRAGAPTAARARRVT